MSFLTSAATKIKARMAPPDYKRITASPQPDFYQVLHFVLNLFGRGHGLGDCGAHQFLQASSQTMDRDRNAAWCPFHPPAAPD
jgi:hypothetical protein